MQPHLSTREAARVELIQHVVSDPGELDRAFLAAARLGARTLRVARVGIWYFAEGESCIECQYLYDASRDEALARERIDLTLCGDYAAALRAHRILCADDALRDPRTRELAEYLARHGITSLLDCPIFERGKPVGVICHEHVGPARTWSKEEAGFAATVADMLGLYIEQDRAQRHYRALLQTRGELEQARVMESVGRMAAGVAHDFNNVLCALRMSSELLGFERAPTPALLQSHAADTLALLDQGARLVQQLSDVAHQLPTEEVSDLVEVAQSLRTFLHTLEPDGIHVELFTLTDRAPVRVARSYLEQVVTNLAVNARDAMLGGGTLTVEVGRERDRGGQERVFVRVHDTGVGMDEHTRERVFEPYFTTKGGGHGLGLATVYRIVRDSGGNIELASAPGAGTKFRLDWPSAD
jgi:two-component system, cell cycle sensor histidine kinase and response regulator CckA